MLIGIVCETPSANEIIVDGPQRSGKQFTRTDEPAVEFLLNTIMPPLTLAELCQLDQRRDLSLEHGKICPTGTGVKVPLFIGALSRAKAFPCFRQIDLRVHKPFLSAPSPL